MFLHGISEHVRSTRSDKHTNLDFLRALGVIPPNVFLKELRGSEIESNGKRNRWKEEQRLVTEDQL